MIFERLPGSMTQHALEAEFPIENSTYSEMKKLRTHAGGAQKRVNMQTTRDITR
jgi:hypothetical protein